MATAACSGHTTLSLVQWAVLFQEGVVPMGERQLGLHVEATPGGRLVNTDPEGLWKKGSHDPYPCIACTLMP